MLSWKPTVTAHQTALENYAIAEYSQVQHVQLGRYSLDLLIHKQTIYIHHFVSNRSTPVSNVDTVCITKRSATDEDPFETVLLLEERLVN